MCVCVCVCVVGGRRGWDCEGLLQAQVGEGRYVYIYYSSSLPTLKWYCQEHMHVSNTVCRMAGYNKLLPTLVSNCVSLADLWHWEASMS